MPVTVPLTPRPEQLARLAVGKPVSAGHGGRWCEELLFNRARVLQAVAAVRLPRYTAASTVRVAYNRSPGAQVLRVEVELYDSSPGDKITVALALAGATTISGTELDGATTVVCPVASLSDYPVHVAYLDVSGVAPGTTQYLAITWASVTGGAGLYRVAAHEVALADADPVGDAANEVGVNGAWCNPPNRLAEGATTISYGFKRIAAELDAARSTCRRHWQWATWEATAQALSRAATTDGPLTWPGLTGGFDPDLYIRARRLYETSTPNTVVLSGRLRMDAAGSSGRLRVLLDGVASGTLTVPINTTSFTTFTAAVSIPTNTTGQVVKVEFDAKCNGAGQTIYCSALSLIENEP